jgi:hypothetical protein
VIDALRWLRESWPSDERRDQSDQGEATYGHNWALDRVAL